MNLPDYKQNSIVNLSSTICGYLGKESIYKSLELGPLRNNIVLMVIDGMGFNYLKKSGKGTVLKKHLTKKLTSVFPTSTASAIPSFLTATAPQQHAITGWYTYLRELGTVSTILPFKTRVGKSPFTEFGIPVDLILNIPSILKKPKIRSFVITTLSIKNSDMGKKTHGDAKVFPYEDLKGCYEHIKRIINSSSERKFIYVYLNGLDANAHEFGLYHENTQDHFLELDRLVKKLKENIANTSFLITSDHGMVDTPKERTITINEHPDFMDYLTLPLCGDQRTAFCYVRPSKVDKFRSYWEDNFKDISYLIGSERAIDQNYFGLHEPHPRLHQRVGDYIISMKDNYAIRELLPNQKDIYMVGNHGGTSEDEMFVPLSVIHT